MSLILTPLGSDSFQRANENPLNPSAWEALDTVGWGLLQVLNDACVKGGTLSGFEAYKTAAPNDQYAQATIASVGSGFLSLLVRGTTGTSNTATGYWLGLNFGGILAVYNLQGSGQTQLGSISSSLNQNDTWTIAVVGPTVYALQNGKQVLTVTDSTYSSGLTGLGSSNTSSGWINFSMGLAVPQPAPFQGTSNAGTTVPIQTVRSGNYTVSAAEVAQGYTNPIAVLFQTPFADANYTCQVSVEKIFGIKAPKPIARVGQFERMRDVVSGKSQGVIVVVELPAGSTVGDLLVLHVTAIYD
jgi:hypothetical protein